MVNNIDETLTKHNAHGVVPWRQHIGYKYNRSKQNLVTLHYELGEKSMVRLGRHCIYAYMRSNQDELEMKC